MSTTSLRTLIVDDEPHARTRLRTLLADMDGIDIAGEADNGMAAIELCTRSRIDLVLLDIRMPGIDGLETARRLAAIDPAPLVVFLTAYDDRAIDAFDTGAVDYLLKPVRSDRLVQSLQRARRARPQARAMTGLDAPARRHFVVRLGARVLRVAVGDVRCLRAEDKYVRLSTADGDYLIEESLATLEREFGERLLRIHRNCLVMADHLRGLLRDAHGVDRVEIDGLAEHPEVSRRNLPHVRTRLFGED